MNWGLPRLHTIASGLRALALVEVIVAWSFFHDPVFVWYVHGNWYEQITYALVFWIAADLIDSFSERRR